MTDPNYWLAGWLVLMAALNLRILFVSIKKNIAISTIIALPAVAGCFVAALYCAGFVVVMP
jgi:hypothetical protein